MVEQKEVLTPFNVRQGDRIARLKLVDNIGMPATNVSDAIQYALTRVSETGLRQKVFRFKGHNWWAVRPIPVDFTETD